MAKKEKIKKPRQIVFSEEIDSAINGYAIGLSFTGIGVFLLLKPEYFAIPVVSYIVGAIIGVFGVLGTGVELSKHSKVKGMGNLTREVQANPIYMSQMEQQYGVILYDRNMIMCR